MPNQTLFIYNQCMNNNFYFHYFSRNRGLLFSCLGIVLLVIAIGVTAGTATSASDKPGLYVVYIGEFFMTLNIATFFVNFGYEYNERIFKSDEAFKINEASLKYE